MTATRDYLHDKITAISLLIKVISVKVRAWNFSLYSLLCSPALQLDAEHAREFIPRRLRNHKRLLKRNSISKVTVFCVLKNSYPGAGALSALQSSLSPHTSWIGTNYEAHFTDGETDTAECPTHCHKVRKWQSRGSSPHLPDFRALTAFSLRPLTLVRSCAGRICLAQKQFSCITNINGRFLNMQGIKF